MRFHFLRGKRPAERVRLWIDFSKDVVKVPGDAPATSVVKAFRGGTDVSDTQVTDMTRDDAIVYATFYGGQEGEHTVVYTLTTAMGFIYQHDILVKISAAA